MDLFNLLPLWGIALMIFLLRIIDVSLGTIRTIAVVQGRVPFAVALGFVEIILWVTAIAQVIAHVSQHPILPIAYAGGFACGNAVGITLEKKLAIGNIAIRIITAHGKAVAHAVGAFSHVVTIIEGSGGDKPVSLIYLTCKRRTLPSVIQIAQAIDTDLFYVVERFAETSRLAPIPQPTGWRAVLKKK